MKRRDHSIEIGADGRITLISTGLIKEIVILGMDWIYLIQDRDQWRTLVNTVMNHRVP
jgi:hypothetical protein